MFLYFKLGGRWANHISKSQIEKKDEMLRKNISESVTSKSSFSSNSNTNSGDTENENFSKNEVRFRLLFLCDIQPDYLLSNFIYHPFDVNNLIIFSINILV